MARRGPDARRLRNHVELQENLGGDDARGGRADNWSTYATVWAGVMPVSSSEAFRAGQLQGSISHRVTIRYLAGVRPSHRVAWGSRVFQITGVRDLDEMQRTIVLDCIEERT